MHSGNIPNFVENGKSKQIFCLTYNRCVDVVVSVPELKTSTTSETKGGRVAEPLCTKDEL